jgi:hypothetical protein
VTQQIEPAAARPRSSSAERMKRLRDRRRQGRMCFMAELEPWAISGLVELGWLAGSRRDDRTAVLDAFRRFVAFALVTQHERR